MQIKKIQTKMIAFQDGVTQSLINEIPSAKVYGPPISSKYLDVHSFYFSSFSVFLPLSYVCMSARVCTCVKTSMWSVRGIYCIYFLLRGIDVQGCYKRQAKYIVSALKSTFSSQKPYPSNAICSTKFTPMSKHFEAKKDYCLSAGKLEQRWPEAVFVLSAVCI